MRQSRSTPAVCRIPPLLVRYTHASRAPVAPVQQLMMKMMMRMMRMMMMRMMKTRRITGVAPLIVLLLLLHATRAGTCLQLALGLSQLVLIFASGQMGLVKNRA